LKNHKIHKILIIQTASIGDVVLATPLIEKLSAFFPRAIIDVLVKKGIESLLSGHPKLSRVIIWDKANNKYKEMRSLVKQIRKEKYEVVINLQRFASTGLITTLSGSRIKVGFSKNPFSLFFTKALKHRISANPDSSEHEIHRNLSLIDSFTDCNRNYPVRLYPSQNDFAKVSHLKTHAYITISPTSLWFTKQFPEVKWIEFLKASDQDLYVYFLGAKNDHTAADRISKGCGHPNTLNLCGKLTFLESAALMRDARMNFVNDSAPQHFASAMNAPVTAIFCSTVTAFGFGPLSEDSAVVEIDEKLDCRPCGLHGYTKCPKGHFKCALDINTDKLTARL